MWFNILKLDLTSIQEAVGDAQATDVNVKTDDRCKKKLQNFLSKIESSGLHLDRKVNNVDKMDEELACIVVENIDKHFSTPPKDGQGVYGNPLKKIHTLDENINVKGINYEVEIDSYFGPAHDNEKVIIFDIDVMSWATTNFGTVRYLSYKVATTDKYVGLSEIVDEEGNLKDTSAAEAQAFQSFDELMRDWEAS